MVTLAGWTKTIATEPFITGPLLLLLTKGPDAVRDALLQVFEKARVLGEPSVNVSKTVTVLKWLLAIGLLSRTNRSLNHLSRNNWSLSKIGAPWNFKDGKEVIVITGGCSGFGALMVKGFSAKSNAQIVVIDVQAMPADLKSLPNVHYFKCDLTSSTEIAEQAAAIKSQFGAATVLINNAGIGKGDTILDTSPEWLEKIFKVNLLCHWQLVQEFLPGMLKQKKGHIVSLASVASFIGVPSIADYSATKVGLLAFHEALVAELRNKYENGKCINTTIVHPTWARTALIESQAESLTKAKQVIIEPSMVSNKIVKTVLSGKSGGQILIPRSVFAISTMRSWPSWLQGLARDSAAKFQH